MRRRLVCSLALGGLVACSFLARADERDAGAAPTRWVSVIPSAVTDPAGARLQEPCSLTADVLTAWEGEPVSMVGALRLGPLLQIRASAEATGALQIAAPPASPDRSSYVVLQAKVGGDPAWTAIELPPDYGGRGDLIQASFSWGAVLLRGHVALEAGTSPKGVSVAASLRGLGVARTDEVLLADMGRLPAKLHPRTRSIVAPAWVPVADDGSYSLHLQVGWDYDLTVQCPGRRRTQPLDLGEARHDHVLRLPLEVHQRVELWCGPDPTDIARPLFESAGAAGYSVPFLPDGPVGGQWLASLRLPRHEDASVTLRFRHHGASSLQVIPVRSGDDARYWCSLRDGAAGLTELK